jgi:hypothetical protein
MKLYIVDGESYYDREYNLRFLDPASYILDPRFELIGTRSLASPLIGSRGLTCWASLPALTPET